MNNRRLLIAAEFHFVHPVEKDSFKKHHKLTQNSYGGNLVPRFSLLPVERPWLGLVTWSLNKINSEGGVLCLSIFLSGSFSPSRNDRKGKTDLL